MVHSTCTCAAAALPRQPYANVALVQWQSATVVPPTYTFFFDEAAIVLQ